MTQSQIKNSHTENVTLIITAYNWVPALEIVLRTVANQTVLPDQVIVADDGSRPEISALIQRWVHNLNVIHVWQKDFGFRAARARNLAISKSNTDYIIFIDGDCLLPPYFVQTHLDLARYNKVLAGHRYMISPTETKAILEDNKNLYKLMNNYKFLRLKLGIVRDFQSKEWRTVRTCNMGVYRTDLLAVGGFDEDYRGWGREDSDLILRLLNNGLSIRSGRFSVCVGHLHHANNDRTQLAENDTKLKQCQRLGSIHPLASILGEK